jgi:hypothetical protein
MNRLILAVALAAGCSLASSAPALAAAAAKNYDCSKPGNANKAVCKAAAKSATAAAKTEKKAVAANARAEKKANAKTAASAKLAGVKVPAARPKAAAAAKPAPAKPGILQRMSNLLHGSSTPAPAAKKPAPRRVAAAAPPTVADRNPAGAIASCKDGTNSHAKVRTRASSRPRGVAKWG